MYIKGIPALRLLCVLAVGIVTGSYATAAVPPAPTPLAPADGASVTVPFTISWSAVTDPNPNGITAYNWQVSLSSSFTSVALQNSTNGQTQDTVSGLPNGSYFWRVQAFSGAFIQGAWSAAQSSSVLESLLQAGLDGEFRDYLGAEQAVMAIELLLIERNQAARLRPQLDALYRLVKDVDAYRSADFIAGLKDLRAAM